MICLNAPALALNSLDTRKCPLSGVKRDIQVNCLHFRS